MNKIVLFLIAFFIGSTTLKADEPYSFTNNQKLRIATTIFISQAMSRGLSEIGLGTNGRIFVSNVLILGPAITSELLSEKPSKNNLISTGIGIVTSNLISISLDW
jgi:hypothetical protein